MAHLLVAFCAMAQQELDPLEHAHQIAMQTKHKLEKHLQHHSALAAEWNDRMQLSKLSTNLNELTELTESDEQREENSHPSFDTAKNQQCFSKMFTACSGAGSCPGDCGNGFAPLLCVQSVSPQSSPNQKLCPDSIPAGGSCCVGAYPFEDCGRNPLCKHEGSGAWLESQGKFSEGLFAKALNNKKRQIVKTGGDLLAPVELSDDEKTALVQGKMDCPPFEAPGPGKPPGKCEDVTDMAMCNQTYMFLATGDYTPCLPQGEKCAADVPPASPAAGVVPPAADFEDEEEDDVAAAPKNAPGGIGNGIPAAPKLPSAAGGAAAAAAAAAGPASSPAPAVLCIGPTISGPHCIDCPEFNYRTKDNVPFRPDSPAPQVLQPLPNFKASTASTKPSCNDPGTCGPK